MRPPGALFESLRRDDSGQDLIEYVLLALLIGVAAAVALGALGDSAATGFDNASDALVTP